MKNFVYIAVVLIVSIAGGQWATDTWAACTGVSLATYNGNWVQAMAAAKTQGNLITVPAGIWPSPQILPYAGLTIRGAGAGVSFVTRNGPGAHNNGGIFRVNVPNVTITDLTIQGWPRANGLSDDMGITTEYYTATSPANLTVQRVNIENMQGVGIFTQDPNGNMTGGLFEDIKITNTLVRYNGAHGVGIWVYKGTSNSTYRRITINGTAAMGIAFDAGTTGDINATSSNNNVLQDITISNTGGTGGGIMITGGNNNQLTNVTISNITSGGPAFAIGIDQSGLGSTGNIMTNVTLANITSGDLVWIDPSARACGNTFNGVSGTWGASDPSHCNTFLNSPALRLRTASFTASKATRMSRH